MKVRTGSIYRYVPNLLDQFRPATHRPLKAGDHVRVVKLHGAPPPNTMGQCHVEGPDGEFAGMVSCNSLEKL